MYKLNYFKLLKYNYFKCKNGNLKTNIKLYYKRHIYYTVTIWYPHYNKLLYNELTTCSLHTCICTVIQHNENFFMSPDWFVSTKLPCILILLNVTTVNFFSITTIFDMLTMPSGELSSSITHWPVAPCSRQLHLWHASGEEWEIPIGL